MEREKERDREMWRVSGSLASRPPEQMGKVGNTSFGEITAFL